MPCDKHSPQSHTWPLDGSVDAAFLHIEYCETICGYCPTPQTDTGERKRFSTARQLSRHVQQLHQVQDPDVLKQAEVHKWLQSRLGLSSDKNRGLTYRRADSDTSNRDATVGESPGTINLLKLISEALWIREERRWAFEALLSTCMFQALDKSPRLDECDQQQFNDILDRCAEDFINSHAAKLWPTSRDHRNHLIHNTTIYDKLWWSFGGSVKAYGPVGTVHSKMSSAQKSSWNRAKPKEEYQGYQGNEEVHSSLGVLVREYFIILHELYATNQGGAEGKKATTEEQSINDLLCAIIESA